MKIYKYVLLIFLALLLGVSSCKKINDKKEKQEKQNTKSKQTKKMANSKKSKQVNLDAPITFLKKKPKFETTSEPIALKYKFKVGQKVNIVHFLKMSMRYNNNLSFIKTNLYGYYEVKKKLENGNYELVWVISRIVAQLKVKDKEGKDKILKYDSKSKENTLPSVEVFKSLLNTSIKAQIDDLGNVTDIDLKAVLTSIGDISQEKFKNDISKKAKQFINISFILLSKDKLKIGDTFLGRTGMQDSSMIEMKSKRKYTLESVSKDKKLAVLKPSIEFNIDENNTKQKIEIQKNSMEGWLLFDIEKGRVKELHTHTILGMKINNVNMKMDMKSKFKVIE